jgi:hypothetical protein
MAVRILAGAGQAEIDAWSRIFALLAITLLAQTVPGPGLLKRGEWRDLLRQVTSRRRDRREVSLTGSPQGHG